MQKSDFYLHELDDILLCIEEQIKSIQEFNEGEEAEFREWIADLRRLSRKVKSLLAKKRLTLKGVKASF